MKTENTANSQSRDYSLDVLRILGTICIILHHYQGANEFHFFPVDFGNGKFYFGLVVELFFMLSGYFSFGNVKKIENGLGFPEYFLKRYLRLLPLMIICTLLYTAFYAILWRGKNIYLYQVLLLCFGLQDIGFTKFLFINSHFWYLSVLLLCYAFFYVSTRISGKAKIKPAASYILLIIAGAVILQCQINIGCFNANTARGMVSFNVGLLLAMLLEKRRVGWSGALICLAVAIAVPLAIVFKWELIQAYIMWILDFAFYPSLIILFKTDFADRVFKHRIIGELGKISYSAYIWHFQLIFVLNSINMALGSIVNFQSLGVEILFVLLVFAGSAISHYLIEKPIDRYLNRKIKLIFNS